MTRLLIVDDEPAVLRALARTFGGAFEVFLAASLDEARIVLSSIAVDAVMSDMRLFGSAMSGVEFLEEVAERWPDTVRVLMSGAVDADYHGLFLAKPWRELDALELQNEIRSRLPAAKVVAV